jgi:parallel beta-helix repeat protein
MVIHHAKPAEREKRNYHSDPLIQAKSMKYLVPIFVIAFTATLHGKTIQEMVDAAKPGDTIMVPSGIHRETVTLKAPITIIGEPGSEIRGSDVWTQWEPAGKSWKSSLTLPEFYHYGYGGQQSKWPEQVFVNDTELRHVASNPGAGEFSLDPQRHVLLGQSPDGATVEVTTRQIWFAICADNVTIRNLRMKNAASDAQANAALAFHKQSGGTVESCVMSDTHGCVVSLGSGKGNKLLNCEIFHGGQTGVHASDGGGDDVISGNRIHDNDRSDFDAGWDGGGIKVCTTTNTLFENNDIWNNRGPGLWCDGDCGNITIRGNRIHHNGGAGIHFEISRGAHITGNVTWDNGRNFSEWGWGAGILLSSSRDCEVDSNLVAWNPDGISVVSADRGQERWNQVVGNSVHDNVVIGTDADPRDPNHNNIYTIAFLQDWKGIMGAPTSNNHAENNRIYLPGPDRSGRFAFVTPMPSLDAFNASPGGKANRYIPLDQAQALLKAAGLPLEPEK